MLCALRKDEKQKSLFDQYFRPIDDITPGRGQGMLGGEGEAKLNDCLLSKIGIVKCCGRFKGAAFFYVHRIVMWRAAVSRD